MSHINIAKKGTYYCPAYKHYATNNNDEINVVCDRCNRENLKICVGYNNKDLFMSCVKDLLDNDKDDDIKKPKNVSLPKRMKPRIFR